MSSDYPSDPEFMAILENELIEKENITKTIGGMIYAFSKQKFLSNVKINDKTISEENVFETIVSLLSKGALRIKRIDDRRLTIEPETNSDKWVANDYFTKAFSGKYKLYDNALRDTDFLEKTTNIEKG